MIALLAAIVFQCPDGTPPPCGRALIAPGRNTVAVLAFEARDTADVYLGEGLADDITTLLTGVHGLVPTPTGLARHAQHQAGGDLPQLGRQLAVRYLVTGSLRRMPTGLRLNIQLIETGGAARARWGRLYDCAVTTCPQLADAIAGDLAAALTGHTAERTTARVASGATRNPRAWELYLRGNFLVGQREAGSYARAYSDYLEASRLDTSFAAPLGRAAYLLALGRNGGLVVAGIPVDSEVAVGLRLAERALRLDSAASDAWMAMGFLRAFANPSTFRGVDEAFARALALDSVNAEAWHQYAQVAEWRGDADLAVTRARRALALDPGRAISLVQVGNAEMLARRFDRALSVYDSALAMEPMLSRGFLVARGSALLFLGRVAEARAEAERHRAEFGPTAPMTRLLVCASAAQGDSAGARLLASHMPASAIGVTDQAAALACAGEDEAAVRLLDSADRTVMMWRTLQGPVFDRLRANERFQRIVHESEPPARSRR